MIDLDPSLQTGYHPDLQRAMDERLSREDRVWLFEHHYKIKDTGGKIRLSHPLRPAQRKVMALKKYLRDRNEPVRIIIGKGRKQGISTEEELDLLTEVIERQIDGIVIAHDAKTTNEILGICKLAYEHYDLPNKPRPYKGDTNKYEMKFDSHDGHIVIDTANNVKAGTGMTPQFIHCSEVAKWFYGEETASSLFQSIGDVPGTTLTLESTFYGEEPLFLPYWRGAYDNCRVHFDEDYNVSIEWKDRIAWNGFYPIFIGCLDDVEAMAGLPFAYPEDRERFRTTLTDYEKSVMERFNVSLEFTNWRRNKLKHKCKNDLSILKQEYPMTPEEAIRTSGRPRFNVEALDRMQIESGRVGRLEAQGWDNHPVFMLDSGEFLTVFKNPSATHRYVIGVDVSQGLLPEGAQDPDETVCIVLDMDLGGEQVATLCGQISEERLVTPLNLLGRWYNKAFVVIEVGAQGVHTAEQMQKIYPGEMLYKRQSGDIGYNTNVGTRHLLIGGLASAIESSAINLHDERTIRQHRQFAWGAKRAEAPKGHHDDHVFGAGLAVIGLQSFPIALYDQMRAGSMNARAFKRPQLELDDVTGYY